MPDTDTDTDTTTDQTDQTGQQAQDDQTGQQGTEDTTGQQQDSQGQQEPETFTREYVQQLRDEAAGHRVRARDRDALAQRLHGALVAATGRLADPSDLPFDEAHLTDEVALTAAIDALLERKPHLASRRPRGDVGQGATGDGEPVDLAGILRGLAS
jgi:hypothetical protein